MECLAAKAEAGEEAAWAPFSALFCRAAASRLFWALSAEAGRCRGLAGRALRLAVDAVTLDGGVCVCSCTVSPSSSSSSAAASPPPPTEGGNGGGDGENNDGGGKNLPSFEPGSELVLAARFPEGPPAPGELLAIPWPARTWEVAGKRVAAALPLAL